MFRKNYGETFHGIKCNAYKNSSYEKTKKCALSILYCKQNIHVTTPGAKPEPDVWKPVILAVRPSGIVEGTSSYYGIQHMQ